VKSLGIGGISSSQVSRICKVLDTQVEAFRSRALEGQYPYVGLNAAYHKIKELGRVVCHGPVTSMTFSMGANLLSCDLWSQGDHILSPGVHRFGRWDGFISRERGRRAFP
jgi:hypothetical protein